jgi:hypothetical protein
MEKLTKTFIDRLEFNGKEKIYFDSELKGFGIRVRNNSKTWIIMYRNKYGVQKKLTLAKTDKLTPDEARKLAKEKFAEVIKGQDPASDKIEARKGHSMNKEDLQMEIDLNKIAYEVLNKLEKLDIDADLKSKIELMAETVMEDTADKIMNNAKITVDND